jgi:hypothetical protein
MGILTSAQTLRFGTRQLPRLSGFLVVTGAPARPLHVLPMTISTLQSWRELLPTAASLTPVAANLRCVTLSASAGEVTERPVWRPSVRSCHS